MCVYVCVIKLSITGRGTREETPQVSTRFSLSMEMSRMTRGMGLPKPSRETKFSGANRDKEILISPVQLTTSRIGNLTGLILTFAIYVTIYTTYNRAI